MCETLGCGQQAWFWGPEQVEVEKEVTMAPVVMVASLRAEEGVGLLLTEGEGHSEEAVRLI